MSPEPLMAGFPPPAEALVTLANWQGPPYNRWAFQHLREVIPTQRISRGLVPRPLSGRMTTRPCWTTSRCIDSGIARRRLPRC